MKLPGKIKKLAAQDAFAAEQLASRGRVFSEVEEILDHYYYGVESLQKTGWIEAMQRTFEDARVESPSYQEIKQGYESAVTSDAENLCNIFMSAVAERNPAKIFEIAEAVAYFKNRSPRKQKHGDAVRAALLCYKPILEKKGIKPTFAKLARLSGYIGNMDVFRRIVRELNIPHKREAGGRQKTPTNGHTKSPQRS